METKEVTNAQKSAAIRHAVEIKSLFDLYAYRIIDHGQFFDSVKQLTEEFHALSK